MGPSTAPAIRRGPRKMTHQKLKKLLDGLYAGYPFSERVKHDPIRFPLAYDDPRDKECVGLIASTLAYGKVTLFAAVLEAVFGAMGPHPHEFIINFSPKRDARHLGDAHYRFQKTVDIAALIYLTGSMLRAHGSIEAAFTRHGEDVGTMIAGFAAEALSIDTTPVYGADLKTMGLKQLFPSPATGGASKRMCLYMRWMVRRADIDMGLWRSVSPARLVIPLDTHISRIGRCLGFTKRSANDWKTATEITHALAGFDAADPLKYDFALCHLGISGQCAPDNCAQCQIRKV